ncbi:MAG: hypothetical protein WCV99_06935 [Sterolibacterium sp.]|jgi:hypothetical protein
MKQILLLSTLIVALSACGTLSDLPPGYSLDTQDAEGLAVVSLTLSGKDLGQVSSFSYRVREAANEATEDAKRRPYFDSARQHARWIQDQDAQGPAVSRRTLIVKDPALAEPLDVIESGRAIGRVATLRLPAGDYELYDWTLTVPNQYGGNEFTPKRSVGYRFKIASGRANYLGNVDLRMTEQETYNVTVENKATRDLAILAQKLPPVRVDDTLFQVGKVQP